MSRSMLAVIAVVVAAALALGGSALWSSAPGGSVLSVENPGPRGLAVAATFLRRVGARVELQHEPLTSVPPWVATVILPAPAGAELEPAEVSALEGFVRGGGTLVYFPSRTRPQPNLERWLQLERGPVLPLEPEPALNDALGSTSTVRIAAGLLAGAKTLRTSANASLAIGLPDAVDHTDDGTLWWVPMGAGSVWVAAGPELAENARLELLDNAVLWAQLAARGPVLVDEHHHHARPGTLPINVLAAGAQLVLVALLVVWSRAIRLGPPREVTEPAARESMEYVRGMAALMAGGASHDAVVQALWKDFRDELERRAGVPAALPWSEAKRLVEQRVTLPPLESQSFLELSRFMARTLSSL